MEAFMNFVTALISLFVSFQAFAGIGEDFRDLKDSGINYEIVGSVCEEVLRLRYQEEFPANKYSVVTGIEYGDGSRTVGELDVIVFESNTQKVVRVGEIKCWKDNRSALNKAQSQRKRFLTHLASGKQVFFKSLHSNYKWNKSHFANFKEMVTVAPRGSKADGFDAELSYELSELMKLRQMLMECQNNGQCKSSQH